MNHEFGNIGRRLPYDLPEHRLEALHERILRNTAARPAPAARTRRLYLAAGVSVAAALLATGILVSGHLSHRAEAPLPDIEQMLATTPTETLQQAAAENYDDILYNQQLKNSMRYETTPHFSLRAPLRPRRQGRARR